MTLTHKQRRQLNILDPTIPARTLIFSLVLPSFIEELGQILTMYVDTAMVGHIPNICTKVGFSVTIPHFNRLTVSFIIPPPYCKVLI